MAIVYSGWREPTNKHLYKFTGKEPNLEFGKSWDVVYYTLGKEIEESYPEGATLADIYHNITTGKGLSLNETREVLRAARDRGFII